MEQPHTEDRVQVAPDRKISTLAGSATAGADNGNGTATQFNRPNGVAVDSSGILYVADANNHRIRKITPGGVVTTIAGDGTTKQFFGLTGVAVDSSSNLYVVDTGSHRIRKITPGGW